MAKSFNPITLKILSIKNFVENIENVAGAMLVKNVKKQAKERLGKKNNYPYDYSASFQQDNVTFYEKSDTSVYVKHPAANRLEYGQDIDLTIRAKDNKVLKFLGKDGEIVYREEVNIPKGSFKPVGYARAAIRDTQKELKEKYNSVVTGIEDYKEIK